LAELHRLRGESAKAEEAYRQASLWGRIPQPGQALLRLAQGRVDAAAAAIHRVVDEAQDRGTRAHVLPAFVEIMLAAKDLPAARTAAGQLVEIAADLDVPFLHAVSAHATGAVVLAEGDIRAALASLRRAWKAWQKLEAPYEAARVRVLIGLACRELGDEDGAEMETGRGAVGLRAVGRCARRRPDRPILPDRGHRPRRWADPARDGGARARRGG
jgi:tetratricopeptide (TPR) repeat protein